MPRTIYSEYRKTFEDAVWPFADQATLSNGQDVVPADLLLDAIIHILGGGPRFYLSAVAVDFQKVTLTIGDQSNSVLATGTLDPNNPPDSVELFDLNDRPAGLLVSESSRLRVFQSWSLGRHLFELEETEFAAACCWPLPLDGVTGILLDDGSLVTGEVWLAGGDGVVLSPAMVPDLSNPGEETQVIRVDVVGDALFRRRLCQNVFQSLRLLQTVVFRQGCVEIVTQPDEFGRIFLATSGIDNPATSLRIHATPSGLFIGVSGETLEGNT